MLIPGCSHIFVQSAPHLYSAAYKTILQWPPAAKNSTTISMTGLETDEATKKALALN